MSAQSGVSYIGKTSKMRFVSNIASAVKATALAHIVALLMGCTLSHAQQVPPVGQWLEVPNTRMTPAMPTTAEIGSAWAAEVGGVPGSVFAWTGMTYDVVNHRMCLPRGGGHDDYSGADSYCIDLDEMFLTAPASGTHWVRAEPVQHLTGPGDSTGGDCHFPAYGPPANHTYGGVADLGNGRLFHAGSPGGCEESVMQPGNFAYVADTTTEPWTWTHWPQLDYLAGIATAAADSTHLYMIDDDGRWAKVNKTTGAIVGSGNVSGVIVNGVTQSFNSSYGAQMGSGAINESGLFCFHSYNPTSNTGYVQCTNTQGAVNGNNNDSFGRMLRRPAGPNAPAGSIQSAFTWGKMGMAPMPGGCFALWRGGKDVWKFCPDSNPLSTAGDTWTEFHPTAGPSGTVNTYQKMFWYAPLGVLAAYGHRDQGVWLFNIGGSVPPNTAPVANDDSIGGAEDTQLTGNVLTNDTDDTGPLTASLLTGSCVIQSNGALTYTPAANFNGQATCTYEVSDGTLTDTGTVTLTVIPVDDPAVVADEQVTVEEEGTINGTVAANDSDIDSQLAYEFAGLDGFTGAADGTFTYVGPLDFYGLATVNYTANGIPGTLTITVTDVPEPVDRYVCEINEFEFPAGETPEEFPLVGNCHFERADIIVPPPPPPPPPAESYSTPTFAARSAGALFANDFNTQPPTGTTGNTHAVFMNGGMASNTNPVMPHVVRSQDNEGALQMEFLPFSNAGAAGQYWAKFSPIGLGETVHIQWRMKFNEAFVETQFIRHDNGGNTAPKLIIVSRTTSSCQNVEVAVTSTTGATKVPTMYNNCNFFTQIPRLINWQYPVDTWVTFNLTLTKPASGYQSGQFVFYDVAVKFDAKPDGGEVVHIVDTVQAMRAMDIAWDAIFQTIYITKKDPAQDHEHVIVLLDETIVSRDPIPFP